MSKWKSTYATVILDCFIENPQLVKTLGTLIPTTAQAESDLVRHWRDIDEKLAQNIRDYSKDRMWLTLHGLSTLQLYTSDESIKRQLGIDTDIKYSAALEQMGGYIPDIDFLHLAVKYGDERLVRIAGTKVGEMPSLINELDISNIASSQIWLAAIRCGNKPWECISEPLNVLYALMEQVVNGSIIDSELLIELSSSDYNDLSQFNRRSEVWQCLSGRAKDNFLNASVLGCVNLLDDNATNISILEREILTRLADRKMMELVVNDQTINTSTIIQLFEELPKLGENRFVSLLSTRGFTLGQSERLGKLILIKHWNKAIDYIVNNIAKREDLKPALIECQSLLGFFDKMKLSILGVLSNVVSIDEWWGELTKQCYVKYPAGPTQMGLWERAGGQNYDIQTNGTGREYPCVST